MVSCWVRGRCVGSGSFGTVNVAVEKRNGAIFAVKSVDKNASVLEQIESLENEIRILRSLETSPYVINYLGDDVSFESSSLSCQTTSYRNLHLEYLPGGTVADLATATTAYVDDHDETVLRSHVFCLVSALRHIHSNSVVHCDVKGRNILVSQNPRHCKLADFGSAREDTCHQGRVTPRGSPLWMAPEVVRGESQGPASDVWSLGCTVVEMITGKPAWEDSGTDTLARIGFSDELPKFPSRLSELGRDFLDKCLRRDPTRRWSCDQLFQHPFLVSVADKPTESSPRCVLDWVNLEFESESEEEDETDVESFESSAKDRVGKLAGSSGANWESDGWLSVREYSNSTTVEMAKTAGTSSVYSDSIRVYSENMENLSGCRSPKCRDGPVNVDLLVETAELGFYGICNINNNNNLFRILLLLLFSFCCSTVFRYILILFYKFFYSLDLKFNLSMICKFGYQNLILKYEKRLNYRYCGVLKRV